MGAELNFQNRGKRGRRNLMFKRRKGKAQKHLSGGTQKGSSCGEEGRFGHNTGSNFPDSTGEVRDGEVSGVSDGAISDVSGSDFSLTGANERTGGGASISCRDFSVGGKDISGGNFSFDVANECAGIAEVFGDTNNSFVYNLKDHTEHKENGKAAAENRVKNSRIIGKIYKPRRMVAAVLAAAMFLFAFPQK